jgi:hypothetical protein
MTRQIGPTYQQPSMITLEERVRHLERTVSGLSEALRLLAGALSGGEVPGDRTAVAEAAQQAHRLLPGPRRP